MHLSARASSVADSSLTRSIAVCCSCPPSGGKDPPPEVGEVYAAIPESEKYYHVEEGDGTRIWYTPDTMFFFTGGDLGSTSIAFELVIEGEALWTFSFPVTVVEDACAHFVSQDSPTMVPHRCG